MQIITINIDKKDKEVIDKLVDIGMFSSRSSTIRNMIHEGIQREIQYFKEREKLFEHLCDLAEKGINVNNITFISEEQKEEIKRVGNGSVEGVKKIRVPKNVADEILKS